MAKKYLPYSKSSNRNLGLFDGRSTTTVVFPVETGSPFSPVGYGIKRSWGRATLHRSRNAELLSKAVGFLPSWAERIAVSSIGATAPLLCPMELEADEGGECRLVREHRAPGRQGVRRCPEFFFF